MKATNEFPPSRTEFDKRASEFQRWLRGHGSEIRLPSNDYEILRFTTPQGVGVIYRNKQNRITSGSDGADIAWNAFRCGDDSWCLPKTKRVQLTHQQAAIIKRDGDECWFCGTPFEQGGDGSKNLTVEHLVSVVYRGPNHISNLVVAHQKCNQNAGTLPVSEKVKLREHLRTKP